MTRTVLGIDLGSAQIKLTRMQLSGRRTALLAQERLPRPREAGPESVAESVRQAIEVRGLTSSRTLLCLNSREALLLPLSFPFTQTKKIAEVLPFELENRIPVDLAAYLWDFMPLDSADQSSSNVLAALYPRERLNSWLEAFEASGIRFSRVELDLAPLAGLALDTAATEIEEEAVLDVGWSKINLARRQGGRIVSLQSISPGIRKLFPEPSKAEDGGATDQEPRSAFSRNLSELVKHIRLGLLAEAGGKVQKLSLIGGGALIEELVSALERETGLAVEPLAALPWEDQGQAAEPPGLTVLSGALCLQDDKGRAGFDLLPADFAGQGLQPLWRKHGRLAAVCLGLILLTWSLSLGSSIYLEHKSLNRLQNQLTETFRSVAPEAASSIRPMQYASVLRSRIRSLQGGQAGRSLPAIKATELLTLISRSVPEDVSFQTTLLSLDRNSLRLNGQAGDYKVVDSLRNTLKDLDVFASVEIIGANVDSQGEGVTFSLRLRLS